MIFVFKLFVVYWFKVILFFDRGFVFLLVRVDLGVNVLLKLIVVIVEKGIGWVEFLIILFCSDIVFVR